MADWVRESGVRWGFDAEHREPFGVRYLQNTWRFGLDRVLTGVAMSDDSQAWLGTALPLDDVGSNRVELAGRFAEYVDRLVAATDRLTGTRPLAEWLTRPRRRRHRADPRRPRRPVAGRPDAARARPGRGGRRRAGRERAAAHRRPLDARRPPRGPPHPRQLPGGQPHGLHDGPDALGAAPRGLPARPRRRRLPAPAQPSTATTHWPARRSPASGTSAPRTGSCCSTRSAPPPRRWWSPTPAPTRTPARTGRPPYPSASCSTPSTAPPRRRCAATGRGQPPAPGLRPAQRRARPARHAGRHALHLRPADAPGRRRDDPGRGRRSRRSSSSR